MMMAFTVMPFALAWLGNGVDVDALVELLGHSSRQRSPTLSWELIVSAGAG
jgi:hypothetical protein